MKQLTANIYGERSRTMKITIYTVNDCQFSKQEKDYLSSHNLQFEERNLETNKEFLTEMLAISDNFAGTPVTKIEKDDGQTMVLKGFTQSEFDEALGYKVAEPVAEHKEDITAQPGVVEPPAVAPTSVAPPLSTPDLSGVPPVPTTVSPTTNPVADLGNMQTPAASPPVSVAPPVAEPPTQLTQDPTQPLPPEPQSPSAPAPVVEPPKAPPDPKLASILGNLQSMSNSPTTTTPADSSTTPPASGMPSVPDPNFG